MNLHKLFSQFQGLPFKPIEVSEAWKNKLRTLTYLSTLVDIKKSQLKKNVYDQIDYVSLSKHAE